jgi:hypothetical protein
MLRNSVAFRKSHESFALLPMKKIEEDYGYGRINDTKSRAPLFTLIEIIPKMY